MKRKKQIQREKRGEKAKENKNKEWIKYIAEKRNVNKRFF